MKFNAAIAMKKLPLSLLLISLSAVRAAEDDITILQRDGTNKNAPVTINGATHAGKTLGFNATTGVLQAMDTGLFSGATVTLGGGASSLELRFLEPSGGGTSYTGFKAPALAGNAMYTLPTADGTNGYVLSTNGTGGLSWVAQSAGSSLTDTYVGYGSGANALTGEAAFTYNATSNTVSATIFSASGGASAGITSSGGQYGGFFSGETLGLEVDSGSGTGLKVQSETGTYIATFRDEGASTDRVFIRRSDGALLLGGAGVELTNDGDGALTILGKGDGSDEDITLNLDDTANTASISSSTGVTTVNFGVIGITTTGAASLGNTTIGNGATSAGVLTLLEDTDAGSNYASFQVPALAANTVYTLPADDGDADQVLSTNGSGTLDWVTPAAGGGPQPVKVTFDGGGVALTSGASAWTVVPDGFTISKVTMLGDRAGSVVVDVYKCTYAEWDAGATHPVSGDKITASAPPTISGATKSQDSTLTGWTTSITDGDILYFTITSATTIQKVTLVIE